MSDFKVFEKEYNKLKDNRKKLFEKKKQIDFEIEENFRDIRRQEDLFIFKMMRKSDENKTLVRLLNEGKYNLLKNKKTEKELENITYL